MTQKTKVARAETGRLFTVKSEHHQPNTPHPAGQDALGVAMSRLLSGWQPETLHYLRRLRSTGQWAVLRVGGGRRTWIPVPSRGAGVALVLELGGLI